MSQAAERSIALTQGPPNRGGHRYGLPSLVSDGEFDLRLTASQRPRRKLSTVFAKQSGGRYWCSKNPILPGLDWHALHETCNPRESSGVGWYEAAHGPNVPRRRTGCCARKRLKAQDLPWGTLPVRTSAERLGRQHGARPPGIVLLVSGWRFAARSKPTASLMEHRGLGRKDALPVLGKVQWMVVLVGMAFLGCAHQPAQPSRVLSVDDKVAIQVVAFRAAMLYRGDPSNISGDLAGLPGEPVVLMCLGVSANAPDVEDPPPRVVRILTEAGAVVAPVSQCRNRGIQPPLLYDGSHIEIATVILSSFDAVTPEKVVVTLVRGEAEQLGGKFTAFQHLSLTIVRTPDGWVTRAVAEGATS
jgi:hypothetical protein